MVTSTNIRKLKKLRNQIDKIDRELIILLKKRFLLVKEIIKIKKVLGMEICDKKREKEIIDRIFRKSNFRKAFIKKIYKIIFDESKRIQKNSLK